MISKDIDLIIQREIDSELCNDLPEPERDLLQNRFEVIFPG